MDSDAIVAEYTAIPDRALQRVLLVEYRCRDGCLLLHVWQSPRGPMYYRPGVPLSKLNGMGRWGNRSDRQLPAHGGLLADFDISESPSPWVRDETPGVLVSALVIGCGHCYGSYSAALIVADSDTTKPGSPVVRNDVWGKPIE